MKKVFIRINCGEDTDILRFGDFLQLMSEEYVRVSHLPEVQRENEFGYEIDYEWLTEEEYLEMKSPDGYTA